MRKDYTLTQERQSQANADIAEDKDEDYAPGTDFESETDYESNSDVDYEIDEIAKDSCHLTPLKVV